MKVYLLLEEEGPYPGHGSCSVKTTVLSAHRTSAGVHRAADELIAEWEAMKYHPNKSVAIVKRVMEE